MTKSPTTNSSHAIKRQHASSQGNPIARPDLFDKLDVWLTSPMLAYSSWISRQDNLEDSTKTVYLAMFGRFCAWLDERSQRLDTVSPDHIIRFLDEINPNLPESRQHAQASRQRWQYIRQLEFVYSHLGTLGYSGPNICSQVGAKPDVDKGRDKPTRFLSPEESRAVMSLIQTRLDELRREQKGVDDWTEYRDLALISVMIGAGLKVGHISRLTLNCIDMVEERIDLSLPGYTHRARILAFAISPIKAWLAIQKQLHGGGLDGKAKVFEADRSVGFGRTSASVTLSPSSIHRRTERLLKLAGISGDRASAQTLRNTYAALLIDGGATDEHLNDFLGLQASVTAKRLREAYAKSVYAKQLTEENT